jgi:aminoglycoside phosphotransferase family enzyme/predicted kinase
MSADAASPQRLLAFLRDARSYQGKPGPIRVVQTHASYLALAGRYVFKVKKQVNFGFLDFSTLEKRRHFCEREVLLNRRLCPGIYLGVVPISMDEDRLAFGLRGEIVEYAVKMRRLSERYFMLRLMRRDEVTACDVDTIVAKLAPFYKAQQPTPEIAEWGRIAKLRISTDENFRKLSEFIGVTISRPALDAIQLYTNGFFRRHAALFAARVRERRIRDCHGDLHLEHIHLSPSRLTIYDCIEFNDRFRCIDVANDTAFLAMDLDFHGRPDFARRFATGTARALADPGMLQLLDFYKCYRASVRGKVESLRQFTPGLPDADRPDCRARAERYFRLALQYAIRGSEPMVLILMGRVGSGKSTLARLLGRELDWEVYSSDRLRKELGSVAPHVRRAEPERRRLYSKAMSDKTYSALARHAAAQIRQQRSVILDATFASRARRDRLRRVLVRAGVDYCFVETRVATAKIKERLKERARSAREISDARLEDLPMLARAYERPTELESQHFLVVKTTRTCQAAALATLKALAQRRSRGALRV